MTDITAFPTIVKVLKNHGPTMTCLAGEAITAGQAVGVAATGPATARTVVPLDDTAGENFLGVAVHDIASGSRGTIALPGCIVEIAVADDTTGIDNGGLVELNDNAVLGTVSEYAPRADRAAIAIDADDTITWITTHIIGMAIEDIAGNGTGEILIQPQIVLSSFLTVVT